MRNGCRTICGVRSGRRAPRPGLPRSLVGTVRGVLLRCLCAHLAARQWRPRSIGGLLVGLAGGRSLFVFRLLTIGILRQRRGCHKDEGGQRTNEDRFCDPHLKFSFGKASLFLIEMNLLNVWQTRPRQPYLLRAYSCGTFTEGRAAGAAILGAIFSPPPIRDDEGVRVSYPSGSRLIISLRLGRAGAQVLLGGDLAFERRTLCFKGFGQI